MEEETSSEVREVFDMRLNMALTLKSGKMEDGGFRRCQQVQCGYYQNGDCRKCDTCNASPFILKKGCNECFECENVPGSLRWGDKDQTADQVIVIKVEEDIPIPEEGRRLEEEITQ